MSAPKPKRTLYVWTEGDLKKGALFIDGDRFKFGYEYGNKYTTDLIKDGFRDLLLEESDIEVIETERRAVSSDDQYILKQSAVEARIAMIEEQAEYERAAEEAKKNAQHLIKRLERP